MPLVDTAWYIRDNAPTSTIGWSAVTAWAADTAISAGAICRQLATPTVGNERCFVCIVAGTTHSTTEPTWVVTRGAKTTDNTVTWQECTGQPALNGDMTNTTAWDTVKNTACVLGQVIKNAAGTYIFICSTAGTAGNGSEPTWNTTAGQTTTDNTVAWTCIGAASSFTTAFAYPHARIANAVASTWGAAGNKFAVAADHSETQASANLINPPATMAAPCYLYCLTNTSTLASPTASTGATVTTTGAYQIRLSNTTDSATYYEGINFSSGSAANAATLYIGYISALSMSMKNCSFTLGNTSSSSYIYLISNSGGSPASNICNIDSCSFVLGATTQSILLSEGVIDITNSTFCATGSVPTGLFKSNPGSVTVVKNSDLSYINTALVNLALWSGKIVFKGCKLASGVSVTTGSFAGPHCGSVKLVNCDSSSTNYRYFYKNYMGTVLHETTTVRTGGATDGTTPLSWNITTSANSKFHIPFVTEDISIWNETTGSAQTVSLYLTTNTALTNEDAWLEVDVLSSATSPQASTVTTKMALFGTPSALTTDGTSTWGGTALTYKYVLSASVTPQLKGLITARVCVAKASTTIYLDRKLVVT